LAQKHDSKEYGYTDRETGAKVNTNTIEGYYSIFKRGMKGVYQYRGEKHLHRYLAEFDFRYSNRTKLGVNDATHAARSLQAQRASACSIDGLTKARSPNRRKWDY
jgi:ISXO2-like transposase domain